MLHHSQRRYAPLPDPEGQDDSKSWTRIMELQPGPDTAPLAASLSIENVEACEPYEALSYVWGRDTAPDRLIRDGAPTQIQRNLDAALRSLRLRDQPRRLWVDAVCIDQQNLDERGSQVRLMRRIYEHAACVVVWLGASSPGVEDAFYLASQLAEIRNSMELREGKSGGGSSSSFREMSRALVNDYIDPELPAWSHLAELFQREWWSRSWCVQEVVASSNSSARCDGLEISMRDLLSASAFVRQRREHLFSGSTLDFWDFVFRSKFQSQREPPSSGSVGGFLNLLASTRDFKATDPRDKVYAFYGIADEGMAADTARTRNAAQGGDAGAPQTLGGKISSFFGDMKSLVSGIGQRGLTPDYHKSVAHVYRDAARFVLGRSHAKLDLLSHVHHTRDVNDPLHGECPTWVPRWFEPQASTPLGCNAWFAACMVNPASVGLANMKNKQYGGGYAQFQPPSNFGMPHTNAMNYSQFGNPAFARPGFGGPGQNAARYGRSSGASQQLAARNNRDLLVRDGFRIDSVASVTAVITADMQDELPLDTLWHELFGTQLDSPQARSARYKDGIPLINAFGITLSAGGYDRTDGSRRQPQKILVPVQTDFVAFMVGRYSSISDNVASALLNGSGASLGDPSHFEQLAKTVCYNRRLFRTESGYLGLGPKFLQPGDVVCALVGGKIPFALRSKSECWALVGEAYLHDLGILSGDTAKETVEQRGEARFEAFNII